MLYRVPRLVRWLLFCLPALGPAALPAAPFLRGDANQDGVVNITDAVATLDFLFLGDPASLACGDAADSNDDGAVNLSDAIMTLNFLFLGGAAIPLPGPESCGVDPTQDGLDCASFAACSAPPQAGVIEVSVTGTPGAYMFEVTVRSVETGCEQYADWWEVVSLEGELLYRRVLAHSHVTEQPFTRRGGTVAVDASTEVIVRAHMNPSGYGIQGMRGSVAGGFTPAVLEPGFAAGLAGEEPLPASCAF